MSRGKPLHLACFMASTRSSGVAPAIVQAFRSLNCSGVVTDLTVALACSQTLTSHSSPALLQFFSWSFCFHAKTSARCGITSATGGESHWRQSISGGHPPPAKGARQARPVRLRNTSTASASSADACLSRTRFIARSAAASAPGLLRRARPARGLRRRP